MQSSSMEEDREIPLLEDPAVSLDYGLLSSFVTTLLYCDPNECPILPTFRVKELLSICIRRNAKTLPNEFRLSFVVLSFNALCFYLALTTVYPSDLIIDISLFLQNMLVESMIFENLFSETTFPAVEMDELFTTFKKKEEIDIEFKLEIFTEGLEIARSILRDSLNVAKIMNKAKDLQKLDARRAAIPKHIESFHGFCFYFFSGFALAHIGMNLQSVGNLLLVPGMIETTIVAILTKPANNNNYPNSNNNGNHHTNNSNPGSRPNSKNSSRISNSRGGIRENLGKDSSQEQQQQSQENTSSEVCLAYIQRLFCFLAHYSFTEKNLELLRVAKNKLVKRFVHPGKFESFF
jgi:hypothetical protein